MPRQNAPTPKQLYFWNIYNNPNSPTFGNAYRSALEAGYTEQYAKSAVHNRVIPYMRRYTKQEPEKISEKITKQATKYERMLEKAEDNIEKDLSIPDNADPKLLALKQKSTHFTAERLGKERWATKTIVENHGLFKIEGDSLAKLANTFQSAIESTKEAPIVAQYTVKADESEAKRVEGDTKD